MIYFAQINNKWAAPTLIILLVEMFEFSKLFFCEEKNICERKLRTF